MLSPPAKKSANYCTFCPKMCHFSCPVAEAEKNEAYTPWGKQQTAKLVSEGVLPMSEENALSAYKCVTCRASQSFCNHKIVVADSLIEFRESAVEGHVAPAEVYGFERKFRRHNNPYGQDLQEKLHELSPSPQPSPVKGEGAIFFPTCHTLALNFSVLKKYFQLFEKLKINSLKIFDEPIQCCGYSLWVLGLKNEFLDLAQIQYHSLKKAETIVVGAPECAWTLKEVYPRFKFPLNNKVLTLSEFVGSYLNHFAFRAKPVTPIRYFYHDSCYLGRYLQQYDEPRKLLEMVTGFSPQEFSFNREESLCSGAGGGYSLISPDNSLSITRRHLDEMQARGINTLVSACPQAQEQFKKLKSKIVVKDLVAFLGENLLP
jgi:Fe-S oxidoreductase